jgi:predicted TIM-barrel enzyme
VLVGSGLDPDNAATLLPGTRGAIVATAAQRDGRSGAPVQVERVRALVAAAHAAWGLP